MKDVTYTVQSWNGKDGILLGEGGEFLPVTRVDLPKDFKETLFVGEKLSLKMQLFSDKSFDERSRAARTSEIGAQQASSHLKEIIAAENKRRALYGVKPI